MVVVFINNHNGPNLPKLFLGQDGKVKEKVAGETNDWTDGDLQYVSPYGTGG
jgi:hypothetical protein